MLNEYVCQSSWFSRVCAIVRTQKIIKMNWFEHLISFASSCQLWRMNNDPHLYLILIFHVDITPGPFKIWILDLMLLYIMHHFHTHVIFSNKFCIKDDSFLVVLISFKGWFELETHFKFLSEEFKVCIKDVSFQFW